MLSSRPAGGGVVVDRIALLGGFADRPDGGRPG
jgi:hypothetical protein